MPPGTNKAQVIDLAVIDGIVGEIGRNPSDVIAILQAIQRRYNHLPREALLRVTEVADISPSAVAGVATFYSQFRLRPAGLHTVRVCIGTACHVKGATQVFDAFQRHLDIPEGEDTDPRRLFTLEKAACLGCCMLAPAVQIDDVTYGFLTSEKVPRVLRDFLAGAGEGSAEEAGAPGPDAAGEVRTCLCSSCTASGADRVFDELRSQARRLSLPVRLKKTACTGASFQAPLVEVTTPGERSFHYGRIAPRDVAPLLLRHFRPSGVGGRVRAAIDRWMTGMVEGETEPVRRYGADVRDGPDIAYLGPQVRIATEHAGVLDPLDLDEYEARGGFRALEMCRQGLSPETVVERIKEAGLRGRGGAGFPTGLKMEAVRSAPGRRKAVICNGDEGDPGAFMDRMILESFPFRVLEGMALAAHAVGAEEAVLYVRAEYPLAVGTIRKALDILSERGILNDERMGWPSVRLAVGAGAFVCGEETALIEAVEGRRGNPRLRPPYPAEKGLGGNPTLVNNVETLALLPWILREGAEAFRRIGTPDSPGTKTFALAGKILRGGLIEVPMGLTLRRIVEDIGGGLAEGRRLKAVQVGGPSGGCLPASLADTPVDYEALTAHGAIMGSGGLVVLDDTDCMVDVARYFLAFTREESCGKCTFCRVGTRRLLAILTDLCEGRGRRGDLEELETLSKRVREGSLCGLGRTAPNPVLSTLDHFREEFEAHVEGRCPAGKCRALIRYEITDDCNGCTRCAQHCPAGAIPMNHYEKHRIDDALCVRCGTCLSVCPENAVKVCNRGP